MTRLLCPLKLALGIMIVLWLTHQDKPFPFMIPPCGTFPLPAGESGISMSSSNGPGAPDFQVKLSNYSFLADEILN